MHARLTALPGVRSVRRRVSPDDSEQFDLRYVRAGPVSTHPVVIIPGGPGVASVLPGKGLRRHAAAAGIDVIMVEHRGVGLSRYTDSGLDLPPGALSVDQVVDDVAAVLDDAGVDTATIYGVSYGSYIAAGVGVRHRHRVHAMILDSPLLSHRDITAMRASIRRLLWDGDGSDTDALATTVRRLVEAGAITPVGSQVAVMLYGLGGTTLLDRQLELLAEERTLLWRTLNRIIGLSTREAPCRNEPRLVSRIAFRELGYGDAPDGLPLDPAAANRELFPQPVPFDGEPYDLVAEMPGFRWPTVVVSGGRDLTTPPVIARRVAALIPDAVLVSLPTMTHSAIDTRRRAALEIIAALLRGKLDGLGRRTAELDRLPAVPAVQLATAAIRLAETLEAAFPARRGGRGADPHSPRRDIRTRTDKDR